MTLTRYLLITGFILGLVFTVLALGSPQNGKYFYLVQSKLLGESTSRFSTNKFQSKGHNTSFTLHCTMIPIPSDFSGVWHHWDDLDKHSTFEVKQGVVQGLVKMYDDDKLMFMARRSNGSPSSDQLIYFSPGGIDRRAEFGIPVE